MEDRAREERKWRNEDSLRTCGGAWASAVVVIATRK
jgi:hypothetical protein